MQISSDTDFLTVTLDQSFDASSHCKNHNCSLEPLEEQKQGGFVNLQE